MHDILCLSDCCCDLIFDGLPALPKPGEEIYGKGFSIRAGGGANTPMGLALLGQDTVYATTLGDDLPGKIVLDRLRAARVSDEFVNVLPGGRTWVSAVLSTREDRGFASFAGDSVHWSDEALDQMISCAGWVHTFAAYGQQYPALSGICRRHRIPLSMDLSYDPAQTLARLAPVLSGADLITPNEQEACALTGMGIIDALHALSRISKDVIITLGKDGCLASLDGVVYRAVPPGVPVVDPTGAGDLFNAGYLSACLQHLPPKERLAWACAAGAACVTMKGGTNDQFTKEKVLALIPSVTVFEV